MFRMSFPLFFFPSFRNDAFVFSKQIRYSYVTQCNATRSDATSGSPLSLPDGAIHHPSMGIIRSAIKSLQKNRLLSSCCRSKIEMESGIIGTRGRDGGRRRFVPSRARGRCILIRMPVARFLLRRTIPFIQSYVIYEHVSSADISLINLRSNIFSTE